MHYYIYISLIPPTIGKRSLKANAKKWEHTTLKANSKEDEKEEWRNTKKLGSLLGDEEDIERRKALATANFKSLTMVWESRKIISAKALIKTYNAFVLPVLLYNCGT